MRKGIVKSVGRRYRVGNLYTVEKLIDCIDNKQYDVNNNK